MKRYWNANINNFFNKLLKLDKNTILSLEEVCFNKNNLKLKIFHKYKFILENIYIKPSKEKNINFIYNGNSYELIQITKFINKKYKTKKYNVFLLLILKNLINTPLKSSNHFNQLINWNKNYPFLSFLLWNIHEWISNNTYKEIMWFNFLEDYLAKRNERDSIDIRASVCSIKHAEEECTHCNIMWFLSWDTNDFYNLWNNFKIDYSFYKTKIKYRYDVYSTFINEHETIVWWSTWKVEEILNHINEKNYDYIHINLCCLPTIIWDDLKSIVKRYKKHFSIPIIFTDQSVLDPYKILKWLLNNLDIKWKEIKKDTCMLIWFPHNKWLYELKSILKRFWVNVIDILLPIIDINTLNKIKNVEKLVIIDTWRWKDAIKLFENLDKESFRVISPFGFFESIDFLKSILKKFKKDSLLESFLKKKINKFIKLKENNNFSLWFILLPSNLKSFLGKFRWLRILNILLDMWFKINIFYYIDNKSNYINELQQLFQRNIWNNLWTIIFSNKKIDLEDFIKKENIDIYYSEISNDNRILKYGKTIFSTNIFEPGIEWAFRSFEKLLKLWKLSRNIKNNFFKYE